MFSPGREGVGNSIVFEYLHREPEPFVSVFEPFRRDLNEAKAVYISE